SPGRRRARSVRTGSIPPPSHPRLRRNHPHPPRGGPGCGRRGRRPAGADDLGAQAPLAARAPTPPGDRVASPRRRDRARRGAGDSPRRPVTVIERSVAPGIHRVDDAYVNWYAIEDGDELTIVDAGLPRSYGALERLLRLLGRPLGAVSALVLTDAHFDHVGFAARLRRRGVPVLVHPDDSGLLGHPLRYDHEQPRRRYHSAGTLRAMGSMALAGAPVVRGMRPTKTFADGETIDVPGR